MSSAETIYETDGPLAFLTFNRPDARNAMTWTMYEALAEACDRVDEDAAVRVLVLRGAGGKAFVAGTDISQFRAFTTAADALAYEERIERLIDRLERVRKPTVAQVQGVAAGGGCVIALACDLRVATPESRFGVPVARTLGNCLAGSTYARLVDTVGAPRAKELLFTARFVDAVEAHAIGLVNRIVPADRIDAAVRELAGELAAHAPLTLETTKELHRRLMAARRLPPGADRDLIERCYLSADFREGTAAFLEKRRPQWTGR